jgi:hypothetical protein
MNGNNIKSFIQGLVILSGLLYSHKCICQQQEYYSSYYQKLLLSGQDSILCRFKNLIDSEKEDSFMLKSKELNTSLKIAILSLPAGTSLPVSARNLYYAYMDSIQSNFETLLENKEKEIEAQPRLCVGVYYINKVNYRGRDFGINQYGIQPTINYRTSKGLSLFTTGYYWSGMPTKWAKTDLGIEYEKQVTKRLGLTLGYERWFFTNGTKEDRKQLNNFTELYLSYDLDIINIGSGFYYMFGTKKSYLIDLEISSYFEARRKLGADKIIFEPVFRMMWGNQFITLGSINSVSYSNNNFFGILDYEAGAQLTYKIKNFEFKPVYNFAYPVNGTAEQSVRPFSYFTFTINYVLHFSPR